MLLDSSANIYSTVNLLHLVVTLILALLVVKMKSAKI